MSGLRWLPLESNPEVMNTFLSKLGVSPKWQIVDVLGLDDDLLAFVPQPVAAMILLFPVKDDFKEKSKESGDKNCLSEVYFMRQTIGNACGTMAMIHAIANNTNKISFDASSSLKAFIDGTQSETLSPDERGELLERNEEICAAHELSAQGGQTNAPNINEHVNHHFVAFVEKNGRLFELDGCKSGPIDHGVTSGQSFLKDAARVCREFMAKDPDNLAFTVLALVQQN